MPRLRDGRFRWRAGLCKKKKEGFIRFNDPLHVFGLSGRRQSQEAMAPTETGIFIDSALLGARTYDQAFNQRRAVIQPLLLMPQTGQRSSRYRCERVLAHATAKTLQPGWRPNDRIYPLGRPGKSVQKNPQATSPPGFWRHLAQAMPNLFFLPTAKLRYFFQPLPKTRDFPDHALQF